MYNPYDKEIRSIHGPYRMNGQKPRYLLSIVFEDGTRTTTSRARWVMIQHLKRPLDRYTEHVDHIDNDPSNDDITNLQILTPAANNRKSQLGKPSPFKGLEKGWTHGTYYGYVRKRCRCAVCIEGYKQWKIKRNTRRNLRYKEKNDQVV